MIQENQRLLSIDVFAGMTIAFMIIVNTRDHGNLFMLLCAMQNGTDVRLPIWYFHSFYLLWV